jgi:hypothetical protein
LKGLASKENTPVNVLPIFAESAPSPSQVNKENVPPHSANPLTPMVIEVQTSDVGASLPIDVTQTVLEDSSLSNVLPHLNSSDLDGNMLLADANLTCFGPSSPAAVTYAGEGDFSTESIGGGGLYDLGVQSGPHLLLDSHGKYVIFMYGPCVKPVSK